MVRSKELKENKLIWALFILLGALAVFTYSILYNGGVTVKRTDFTEVIQKLKDIQVKGGEFELTQKDLEELSSIYFAKPENKGNITFKGINIEMLKGKILVKAPIIYKGFNLLLTSTGKIDFSNGEIICVAENFKIGKLFVPKNLVISQISKFNDKFFYVEDNSIKINPRLLPFKIYSFKIVDNKILAVAEKLDTKTLLENFNKSSMRETDKQIDILKEKIQGVNILMNEAEKQKIKEIQNKIDVFKDKSIEEKKKVLSDVISKLDIVINDSRESGKKKELEKLKVEVEKKFQQQRAIMRLALTKAKNELSNVYSQVATTEEQKLITTMSSTLSKMIANPSYNSAPDKASIMSIYGDLNPGSKNRVKSALFWNIDGDSIGQLRQAFGL